MCTSMKKKLYSIKFLGSTWVLVQNTETVTPVWVTDGELSEWVHRFIEELRSLQAMSRTPLIYLRKEAPSMNILQLKSFSGIETRLARGGREWKPIKVGQLNYPSSRQISVLSSDSWVEMSVNGKFLLNHSAWKPM